MVCQAKAHLKIARMTLTINLDRNWNSFQLAKSTPPPGVTGSAIAPSTRMPKERFRPLLRISVFCFTPLFWCAAQERRAFKTLDGSLKGVLHHHVCEGDETLRKPEQAQSNLPREKLM